MVSRPFYSILLYLICVAEFEHSFDTAIGSPGGGDRDAK